MRGSKMWILWCFWDFILVMKLNTNSWNSTKLLFFPNDICKVFLKRKQQNLKKLPFLLNNSLSQHRNFTAAANITVCLRKFSGSGEWLKISILFFWVGAWCSSLYLHKPVWFFSEVHTLLAWGMFRVFLNNCVWHRVPESQTRDVHVENNSD